MKHNSRRKNAKRRYKHLVAALAGAAVVTSALLPGLPISKVHAAENTVVASPAPITEAASPDQTTPTNVPAAETTKDRTPDRNTDEDKNRPNENQTVSSSPVAAVKAAAAAYGFDRHDSFSLQWQSSTEAVVSVRTDNGKTFRVRLTKDNDSWKIDSVKEIITGGDSGGVIHGGDPVDVVRDNAGTFGFDAYNDTFTLLSVTGGKAIVEVKTSGQKFKVDLERSGGKWVITTIRGIGNGNYPATYRPASLYGYRTLGAATGPVVTANERVLYTNDSFAGWTWNQSTYPADMKLGVLLSKPQSAAAADLPGIIVDKVDSIDFGRQVVLYAHIGSVTERGYGIGIEKVVQTGNDLTVTIRTKSPLENHRLSLTKTNDVIPIDRLALNFDDPIHIKFVDQNGTTLSTYTVVKR
ncbi:hypothetical protein [Sporomusa malonica]|uniref:PrcB C-terminal n=1 Tax=Sporomusa malonica TaxID=112901 RepID=A0A1W1YGN3_9FIRM|nr:hypothetical protein [Sporomusa malonica]SMC35325.1 hypothetical protein SAMN04488500_101356 [Sporomusa malonica]